MVERRAETQLSNLVDDEEVEFAVRQWVTESGTEVNEMGRHIMRKLIRDEYLPSLDEQGNLPDNLHVVNVVEHSFAIDIMIIGWNFDIFSSSLRVASRLAKQKLAQTPKSPPPRDPDTLGKIGGTDPLSWENDWSRFGRGS